MRARKTDRRAPPPAPTKFDARMVKVAAKMAELGATELEIADTLGVTRSTLLEWRHTNEEFAKAIGTGKHMADERVERSLYHRANGYTYDAQKIVMVDGQPVVVDYREHVPPDTAAGIFWLKNRRPKDWRMQPEEGDRDAKPAPVRVVIQTVDASVPRDE
jgi:hypothetical protein